METEAAKTLTEGDVPSLPSELAKPDETLPDGSGPALDLNAVRVSATDDVDLNGDNDLIFRKRIVETEVTVEKIFGIEDEADLADDQENENESDSALDMEKDGTPLSLEGHGSANETEKIDLENRVDETEDITAAEKQQFQDKEDDDDDGGDDFADMGDKNHNYHVGDFVWGKIRSHPWWPGQIYDPSDASASATKLKRNNRLLVAYFGDGSFSWCHPSQLKPFVENFDEMSKQSTSRNFACAVEEALDEISRVVELETTHLYIPEGNQKQMVVAKPVNAGIRAEANVPEGNIGKLLISQYGSAELLAIMRNIGRVNSFKSLLQFVVLKSWLSSFYLARGRHKLCSYSEPNYIEGLEDDKDSIPVDVPIQVEEEWVEKTAQKVPEVSDDKRYQRRKQKSVADLMKKEDMDASAMSASAKKKRGRKVKAEVSESGKKKMKVNDETVKESLTSRSSGEKDDGDDDDDVKSKDEMVKSYLAREKKKSRYLSPPYTDLKWGIKNLSTKKDSETDSDKVSNISQIGVRMTKAASQLIGGSPSILKSCVEKSQSKIAEESRLESPKIAKNVMEIGSTLNEVLSEVRSAAVNPLCLMEEKNLEMMTVFFTAFRDSVYLNGSNYKMYNKGQSGKKRKSSDTEEVQPLEVKNGSKKKKVKHPSTNASSGGTEGYKKDSPALLVTFPPGFSLPSKDDIINIFSKFGDLNEAETDISYNSFCARLVFINSSDAEEAFNVSVEKNPFGSANVNFRLRYPSAPKEKNPVKPISQSDNEVLKLGFVKQKLEVITKMVEDSGSEISKGLKANLEGEMKGLLEKVSEMLESN